MLRNEVVHKDLNDEVVDLTYFLRRGEFLKFILPYLTFKEIIFLQRVNRGFHSIFNGGVTSLDVFEIIKSSPSTSQIIFNTKTFAYWSSREIKIWSAHIHYEIINLLFLSANMRLSDKTISNYVKNNKNIKLNLFDHSLIEKIARNHTDFFFVLMFIKAYVDNNNHQDPSQLLKLNMSLFKNIKQARNKAAIDLFLDYWAEQHRWDSEIKPSFAIAYDFHKKSQQIDKEISLFYSDLFYFYFHRSLEHFLTNADINDSVGFIDNLAVIDEADLNLTFSIIGKNTCFALFKKLSRLEESANILKIKNNLQDNLSEGPHIAFCGDILLAAKSVENSADAKAIGIPSEKVAEFIQAHTAIKNKKSWRVGFFTIDIHSISNVTHLLIHALNELKKDSSDDAERYALIHAYYQNSKNVNRDFYHVIQDYFGKKHTALEMRAKRE